MAGGTLGYNWQIRRHRRMASKAISTGRTSRAMSPAIGVAPAKPPTPGSRTFRGRVGYAFDRWLPYFTGGGAYGKRQGDRQRLVGVAAASMSSNQLGWTVGGGVEYAFMGNWTAKLEYLYVDLGSFDADVAPAVNNVSFKENIVRAGLNYKFSGPIFSRF